MTERTAAPLLCGFPGCLGDVNDPQPSHASRGCTWSLTTSAFPRTWCSCQRRTWDGRLLPASPKPTALLSSPGGISGSRLSDSTLAGLPLLSSKAKPRAGTHGSPGAHLLPPCPALCSRPAPTSNRSTPQLPSSQLILPSNKFFFFLQDFREFTPHHGYFPWSQPRVNVCIPRVCKQGPGNSCPWGRQGLRDRLALPLATVGSPWGYSPPALTQHPRREGPCF